MSPAFVLAALRCLRMDRAGAVGLALVVLCTSALAAAAPRLADRLADAALREEIAALETPVRGITFSREGRLVGSSDDALGRTSTIADELIHALAGPVGALVAEPVIVVDSARWAVTAALPDPTFLRFRVAPGIADRVRFLAGRAPSGSVELRPDPESTRDDPQPDVAVYEVAISRATAATLHAGPGDEVPLSLDPRDALAGLGRSQSAVARIVGVFEVIDPDDGWWFGDRAIERPNIRVLGADVRLFDTTAWLADEAFRAFMVQTGHVGLPARYQWRFDVVAARLQADERTAIETALRRLEVTYPPALGLAAPTAMRSGLRSALEASGERWSVVEAVLLVLAVGPAAMAFGALALVAALAAPRRRSALALARGRGASGAQVAGAIVVEGLLVGGPAAAAGAALAVLGIDADPLAASLLAAAATAAATIGLLLAVTLPGTGRPGFGSARDLGVPRRTSARRRLLESALVVGAVGAALLLRGRTARIETPGGTPGGADPLVAAIPALLGLASSIVIIRAAPILVGLAATLARSGRGVVLPLGLRRAAAGGASRWLLVILLGAAAAATFSSAVVVGLERGAEVSGWARVGAPYRLESITGGFSAAFEPSAMPGVSGAAVAGRVSVGVGRLGLQAEAVTLDIRAYDELTAGTPIGSSEPGLPIDMFGAAGSGPLPVIVSAALAARSDGIPLGATANISIEGRTFDVRAVQVREAWPAMSDSSVWLVLDRAALAARFPGVGLAPVLAFLEAPDDAASAAALQAWVDEELTGTYLLGRATLTESLHARPAIRAIVGGAGLTGLVAAAFALVAAVAALALAGSARAAEAARLRALGLDRRSSAALVALEHGPSIVIALAGGALLGVLSHEVLRPSLGLAALTDAATDLPLAFEAWHIALAAAGAAVVTVLAVGLGVIMERAAAPAAALRRGFE